MRFLFLLGLLASFLIYAPPDLLAQQNLEELKKLQIFDNFGVITDEELYYEPSHSYPYEYLSKQSFVRLSETGRNLVAVIDYLIRIKVFSDDPFDIAEAAMVGIPFYFADDIERIMNLEGITHNPDGTRSYLHRNDTRIVDLNSRYKIIEFEMPDVQKGSVIEYKYTLERRYIEELPDFYLSHRVPTRYVSFYLQNSNFARFETVSENVDFELKYEEQRVDTSGVPMIFTYRRPEPVYIQRWTAGNIPPLDVSSYVSSIDDIRSKLRFQISEFGQPRQPLENSWEFVAAQILRNNNPFNYTDDYPALMALGRDIAEDSPSDIAAMTNIFKTVNSSVQFNGQRSVFADGSLDHVLAGDPASQSEINLVLLAMLRGAGLDARPLYFSAREFGRINKSFPSLFQFNSMLIVSEIEGENYFMDASFPHSLPNLIPVESYNEQGMVLTEKSHEWIDISPDRSVFSLDIFVDARLTSTGSLTGTMAAETRGYPSQLIRQNIERGLPLREIIAETFFDVYDDAVIEQNRITIDGQDNDIVRVETNFTIPNYAITFTEGLEFRPMVVGYLFRNPFESTERRSPITLDAPELLNIHYKIQLPDGYSFDVSGETRSTSLVGARLFEEYIAERNTIEYSFNIEINRKEFPADVYSQLRRMYARWVDLSNDVWFIENQRL
jgi:hypothetical protein